jgi:hypothetical protein
MKPPRPPIVRTYRWPTGVGFVTTIGLLSALMGDGVFDAVSWVLLGLPLLVVPWALLTRGRRNQSRTRTPTQERQHRL